MICAARSTSARVIVGPPMMLKTMPLALSTGTSRSGLEMAATAASSARVGPRPVPMPMSAAPASFMTARTSAKSTLMRPGFTMISEMPTMPWRSTSSATRNASASGAFAGTMLSSLSLDTTMSVSTSPSRRSMASMAWRDRLRPSKPKGFVTTPTVSAPSSLATDATMGAAPDPVPPPMPAVTKTMSAPDSAAAISARDSSAAASPCDGLPPAPKPRVVSRPMFIVFPARLRESACASVFMAQKSTKEPASVSTMRFTAFPPPPPTPTTLIQQGAVMSGAPSAV
mmetsp:Transcript_1643/g.5493  ORF Transcript_1643/g.5493 Transcript_1643/m.5493 type:complete len:284 (-) Transcript_1643:233-1084(-)